MRGGLPTVLQAVFSGSGAADTQFVATLTKPLYDKVGYDKLVAAGIIATVGSIAYITPPVMGSISFLMVEMPLLQRYILYVGQPAYAFATVVSALLMASGLALAWLVTRGHHGG